MIFFMKYHNWKFMESPNFHTKIYKIYQFNSTRGAACIPQNVLVKHWNCMENSEALEQKLSAVFFILVTSNRKLWVQIQEFELYNKIMKPLFLKVMNQFSWDRLNLFLWSFFYKKVLWDCMQRLWWNFKLTNFVFTWTLQFSCLNEAKLSLWLKVKKCYWNITLEWKWTEKKLLKPYCAQTASKL